MMIAAFTRVCGRCAWFDRGMKKILLSWSGERKLVWALKQLGLRGEFVVAGLVTTVNKQYRSVWRSMGFGKSC